MSLICALSREIPEQPVVSSVSGSVFEKRLVEKYIEEYGTDPINGQPLAKEQLIEIKTSSVVRPKIPTMAGIPGLLKTLQDEWDALMLYNHAMKQQLQTTRQELSHALYQHDAACRVISRQQKELSAARDALAHLKPHQQSALGREGFASAPQVAAVPEPVEPQGIPEDVLTKITARNAELTAERKKKFRKGEPAPEGLVGWDELKTFRAVHSVSGLHSASTPGITCIDVQVAENDSQRAHSTCVTGGNDKMVVVHERKGDTEKVVANLRGHADRINRVAFLPNRNFVVSASDDCTFRVWNVDQKEAAMAPFGFHRGPVTAVHVHPARDYVLTASRDTAWAFTDAVLGKCYRVEKDPENQGLTAAQFHPDGMILGVGTDAGVIRIWDIREGTNVANFVEHMDAVSGLAFSENGYHLVSAAADCSVRVWDLRKLKTLQEFKLPANYKVHDVVVDQSASYLGVAGTDVRLYRCKEWSDSVVIEGHAAEVTGLRFGPNAGYLVSCSLDRTVKYYGT
ncbi:pre-mRNA-processing factor 19-like [Paramacrobiotus metropolitanus]|uniref:pre-mRNA-processing factor 19-like n=1 Tax=Paramacrobiotus metropolitanus TaxID=2943436 RepID=UPI0024462B53|nr:pre-mRNA-processing factor 19-like [Paramacrobiotus metropolitanus]